MNFIGRMEGQEIKVELKYCERCGGLWLRPRGADGVYCASCRLRLEAMPDPGEAPPRKARRRKARLQGTHGQQDGQGQGKERGLARIECLQGAAVMEVWA
jgi:Zn-finger nucleic acid-binding protein